MGAKSAAGAADEKYFGVAEALVVGVDDPEHEGRVTLKFPWLDQDEVSDWCRVGQLYAGKGYGTFWVPEPGDEVLVAFVHGDLRLPMVIGCLYNGSDKPSTSRAADKDQKLLRTKAGHEILLDDTRGKEQIALKTPKGHRCVIDDANQRIELSGSNGPSITLDLAANSITLDAQTIKIKADTLVEVKANTITLN